MTLKLEYLIPFLILFFLFLTFAEHQPVNLNVTSSMKITSDAFIEGQQIPIRFSCDGQAINPPLKISGVPAEAKSLVLIYEDPDAPAGTFTHWLVWDISPNITEVKEGQTGFGTVGNNGAQREGYYPPCPPNGSHRYIFRLYALDRRLNLPAGSAKPALLDAMQDHILTEAELMGRYSR